MTTPESQAANKQNTRGSVKLPLGDLAKASVRQLFPQITEEQAHALREGLPVPPSPNWAPDAMSASDADYRVLDTMASQWGLPRICSRISCILPLGRPERLRRARKAVNQFVAQRYPFKRLIVVNGTDTPVLTHPHPEVVEIRTEQILTGPMRNEGIRKAIELPNAEDGAGSGMVFPFWDDDDVYHPYLLTNMARFHHAAGGQGIALTSQIRVDIRTARAYLYRDQAGIPNTMLVNMDEHFDEVTIGDDVSAWKKIGGHVIPTDEYPWNLLKICIYDGNNISAESDFLRDCPPEPGRFRLPAASIDYLQSVLRTFGLTTRVISEGVTP
jgi:hypothetical protein